MRPFNPDGVRAYFISFRCYGTWLHGDERGSMNRTNFHTYGTPPIPPDLIRKCHEVNLSQFPPFRLNPTMRELVEKTIQEVCAFRQWHLFAANAQSEHVHTVLAAPDIKPEKVLNDFKTRCTRQLRENPALTTGLLHRPIWSRHGSAVWLWTENQLSNAIQYTISGQGESSSTYRDE